MNQNSKREWIPLVGQRVKLSAFGLERAKAGVVRTGTVVRPPAAYPDSVRVLRDGAKSPLIYHTDYWEIGK